MADAKKKKITSPFKIPPIIYHFYVNICTHPKAAFRNRGGYLLLCRSYVNTRLKLASNVLIEIISRNFIYFTIFSLVYQSIIQEMTTVRLWFHKLDLSKDD